jgi:hypothetical protein
MARYGKTRIAPFILVFLIIIVAITAIVALARAIFIDDGSQPTSVADVSREALLSTTPERKVRMTVRGPIVADETFYSYRIEIVPSSRILMTYNGYLERQIDTVHLTNNIPAYDEFVHALDKANLAKGTQLENEKDDTRGICATGRLYDFAIINGDNIIKRLWTSTCKGSSGSLDASVDQLSNLFIEQIPNGNDIINKVDL